MLRLLVARIEAQLKEQNEMLHQVATALHNFTERALENAVVDGVRLALGDAIDTDGVQK